MTAERVRARVFGEVAEDYDRFRPDYPAELLDDVIAYAGISSESDAVALEIGAGTGKATVPFAARGLPITAIEPDPAMAAVLRRRHSMYRMLAEADRTAILDAVADLTGASVDLDMLVAAYLARRKP